MKNVTVLNRQELQNIRGGRARSAAIEPCGGIGSLCEGLIGISCCPGLRCLIDTFFPGIEGICVNW